MNSIEDRLDKLIIAAIVDKLVTKKIQECVEHKLQGCSDEDIRQEIQNFVDTYEFLWCGDEE